LIVFNLKRLLVIIKDLAEKRSTRNVIRLNLVKITQLNGIVSTIP